MNLLEHEPDALPLAGLAFPCSDSWTLSRQALTDANIMPKLASRVAASASMLESAAAGCGSFGALRDKYALS